MFRRVLTLLGALALGVAAFVAFVVVAMRTGSPGLLKAVRRFNKAVTNRFQLRVAGRPGAYASVIRHRGRESGRIYETPVVPFPTDDGFVIALPYGPNTDWVRNLFASGSAELVTEGSTYPVERPEVVASDAVWDVVPANEQRTRRWFGVSQCVRLRRSDQQAHDS
jgi:hypothetical protein